MRQTVIVAAIVALIASTIIGATYSVEPAKAQFCKKVTPTPNGEPFGESCVAPDAKAGGYGSIISSSAQGNGLQDCRAAGNKAPACG